MSIRTHEEFMYKCHKVSIWGDFGRTSYTVSRGIKAITFPTLSDAKAYIDMVMHD